MIFSKIDKKFSLYRNVPVYLFGASSAGMKVKKILEGQGISIKAFVDNNIQKQGKKFAGVEVISFIQLCEEAERGQRYVIQIASTYEDEIKKQLMQEHLDYISYEEFKTRTRMLSECLLLERVPSLKTCIFESKWKEACAKDELQVREYLMKKMLQGGGGDRVKVMLSAPKTGNTTILSSVNPGEVIVLNHSYVYLKEFYELYLKNLGLDIIIGIRDAISHNFSMLYQWVEADFLNNVEAIWREGSGVQEIFDRYIISEQGTADCWHQFMKEKVQTNYLVQDFFEQQLEPFLGIDIYDYPFDVEKGWSVYEIGKNRIMIYQLERMSDLTEEIGEFLGIKDFVLAESNVGEEKWYANYYHDARKNIRLSPEYFESCYTGKYMTHFYSADDIERFRKKWEGNVSWDGADSMKRAGDR